MRVLPAALQAHLATGATTLCWCWRVTRNDATVLGFTDHDHDLDFDGTVFDAATGFTGTEIDSQLGLAVDNLDVESVLKSERLNETDLAAGLFDNALVEIFRVNWADTDQRVLMRYGNLGEVARGQHAFRAEIRGLAHEFQQPKGRVYQFACDADLGDARCGVDLDNPAFKGEGTVNAVLLPRTFTATGLSDFNNDWFTRGLLTWTGGPNAGLSMEVKLHSKLEGTVTIELWQRMAHAIEADHEFTITAGCDKQFLTCKQKFDNVANFRGFPHMPGNDFALSTPNRDDSDNDGGSLFR